MANVTVRSNSFSVITQGAPTSSTLATTAANLVPGAFIDLDTAHGMRSNQYDDPRDIQWMTIAAFYDANNQEIQYIGKGASGENSNLWSHYVFDITANVWYRTLNFAINGASGSGHAWQCGFDPTNGNFYVQRNTQQNIQWFNRAAWFAAGRPISTNSLPSFWNNITIQSSTNTGVAQGDGGPYWSDTVNGLYVHPNCFGPGAKGLVVVGAYVVYALPLANPVMWYRVSAEFYQTYPYFGGYGNGGGPIYCPGADSLVLGAGQLDGGANGPAIKIPAGSSVADRTTAVINNPPTPIPCIGAGGVPNGIGKMIQDPRNLESLLILNDTNGDVYRSDNYGTTWTSSPLSGVTHPLYNIDGSHAWTAAMCNFGVNKNVIIGFASYEGVWRARMWKPGF